jgi:hypothetical protein
MYQGFFLNFTSAEKILSNIRRTIETYYSYNFTFSHSYNYPLFVSNEEQIENNSYSLFNNDYRSWPSFCWPNIRSESIQYRIPSTSFLLCHSHLLCIAVLSEDKTVCHRTFNPYISWLSWLFVDGMKSVQTHLARAYLDTFLNKPWFKGLNPWTINWQHLITLKSSISWDEKHW